MKLRVALLVVPMVMMLGCLGSKPTPADLGMLYNHAAQNLGDARTPVIVIPGILGSKLVDFDGTKVWGSFTFGAADADTAAGARQIALPMHQGVPLSELKDRVDATDVLDVVVADVGLFRGLEIGAYVKIMETLAAGRYRDQSLGRSGAVDYGGLHYTCFQYPYDWRRDVSEMAIELDRLIRDGQQAARVQRGQDDDAPVRVDVVAHSMGGMVLRYYLRYGAQPLPDDGAPPPITWAGAKNIRHAILVATPNGGSVLALQQLVNGWDLGPIFPNYRPSVLGTMPGIYELLPRPDQARVVDAETGASINLYDPAVWEHYGWGLLNPKESDKIAQLLPDVQSEHERHEIARDHLRKCLAKAEQFHRAIDVPASPPPGTTLSIFVGDSIPTTTVLSVTADGRIHPAQDGPGDGTVTRESALMDLRTGHPWQPFLQTPISWDRIQFLFADHIGLTQDAAFADNLLFMLLESPSEENPP